METQTQDNAHKPIPMCEEIKKMTAKELLEIIQDANKQEELGQYFGIYPKID